MNDFKFTRMKTQTLPNRLQMLKQGFGKQLLLAFLLVCGADALAQNNPTYTILQAPCNNDGVVAIDASALGLTPPLTYTYHYYYGDPTLTNVIHTNGVRDTIYNVPASGGGYFNWITVSVTDVNGNSGWVEITGLTAFNVDYPTITPAICPALGSISLTINQGQQPASVEWYDSQTNAFVGTGNPISVPAGAYYSKVTDANGCVVVGVQDTGAVYVWQTSNITFNVSTTPANCTNGTATVSNIAGGVAPYTYQWANGANSQSISNLIGGYHSVMVIDAQGCYTTQSANVQQAVTINVNSTPTPATCVQNDGSVIAFGSGGTPPYTYQYSNGMTGQSISGLSGNTYLNVTVTDANGCIGNGYTYINTLSPITVTYTTTSSSCTAPTGSATLSINGGTAPYSTQWNTFPAQTGNTATNLAAGNYSFTVTDAVGCVRSGTVTVPPQSTLNAQANASNLVCPATTGNVWVNANGSNPPFTYAWNTGATTSSINNAVLGYNYSCVITDAVGCSVTKYVALNSVSPVNISFSTTDASCIYAADGSALANAYGGTAPYTYHWSGGQTASVATGIGTGYVGVTVTDANGCSKYKQTYIGYDASNTSCYCTIKGKVYVDQNNNCQFDSGEQGVEHVAVHATGLGYVYTDANGDYSFLAPTGTYTLSEVVQTTYPLASCQNNMVPVSVTAAANCTTTVDFANVINPIHDIHIVRSNISFAIPGNTYTQAIIVQNDGTISEPTIQLGSKHDGQLGYVSAFPAVYTQQNPTGEPDWYSVISGLSLTPGASTIIYTDYNVPTNIPLATEVNFWDSAVYAAPMSNWLNDNTPWNNVEAFSTTIIGSYDPNFKEVSPKGWFNEGYITTLDSVLDYIVHFQNTGSYYAQKVVLLDTLDADLDWSSFRPGYSDHNYTVSLSENGVLKFTFDNINLPWQAQTEMGSRGMVAYSIRQKPNLNVGTEIRNSAAIYFDYNTPVITNQTLNTIADPSTLGISEQKVISSLKMYPNPATSELNIQLSNDITSGVIHLYDVQGRLLQNQRVTANTVQKIDVNALTNGFYFITVDTDNGTRVSGKFVKN